MTQPASRSLAAQLVDLVAEAGGVLELQLGRGLVHLLFERQDEAAELLLRQRLQLALDLVALALAAPVLAGHRRRRRRAAAATGCR